MLPAVLAPADLPDGLLSVQPSLAAGVVVPAVLLLPAGVVPAPVLDRPDPVLGVDAPLARRAPSRIVLFLLPLLPLQVKSMPLL